MSTQKKLKIGFVFDDSLDRTDGVQQYILTLGAWLSKQGHAVRYLVGQTSTTHMLSAQIYSLAENFTVSGNQNTLSLPLPASKKRIKSVLEKETFDILHVQMPYNPLLAGRVISLASDMTAIVGTFHIVPAGSLEVIGSKILGLAQKRTLNRFNTYLSVSSAAQRFAHDAFKFESVISPNVVDVSSYKTGRAKPFLRGERATITFLGRLVERKGCEHLLHALSILKQTHELEGIRINICGDGPLRKELEEYVQFHELHNHVFFHGYIAENEKADFLASSDIAVFPATGGESFGIVLIEAMAARKPVVLGGANSGYTTVLEGSEDQLFEPQNHEQLAALIRLYLNDTTAVKKALKWQRTRIAMFDIEHVGPQVLQHYIQSITCDS